MTQPRGRVCNAWSSRVAGAARRCAATTTSGLQVDDLGVAVYWALGTYQGSGVLGSAVWEEEERKRSEG